MGSNPIFSDIYKTFGDVLQLAECMLCKLKVKTLQNWNLTVQPLPTQLKKYTLLRSPHVNKKSREQIQVKTCQVSIRLTKIKNPLAFLILLDGIKLLKLDGIQLKCSFKAHSSV